MTDASLISIIINNYNYAHYLPAAIESALGQTYPSFEVIVVDDGSSDHSLAVMANYAEIIPVVKTNGGQASAMNAGFERCQGEIVIFLDADDVLLPETAILAHNAFQANPNLAKAMFRMAVIDADGEKTGQTKPHAHLPLRSGDLRPFVLTCPFDMTWVPTSGNAFAAHALRQIMPIPTNDYPILADYYLCHLTALLGDVAFLPKIGAYYRVHGQNNHEQAGTPLSHKRQNLAYAMRTCDHIHAFSRRLKLPNAPQKASDLYSVSLLSKRLTSLKLDKAGHPIPNDSLWRLYRLGLTAVRRRFDISPLMKTLFVAWFTLMLPAPKRLAAYLAELFSSPEKRQPLNRLLGRLHLS